tara:strand:- start:2 stop:460 length:459 start_codon:yes stop_codon:yes gene_type:complete
MRSLKNINLKKILSFFLHQDGSPYFNAKGVAAGVFSGCFPFFGFQILLGLFLARITKGNLILAAIGTWISNPFTYIPLYYFNYKVGSILLKTPTDSLSDKNLLVNDLWKQGSMFSLRLILGSSLVGLFLALISGFFVFWLYKIRRKFSKKGI